MESTLTKKQISVIVAGTQSTNSTSYTSIGTFAFNPADFDSPMEPSTTKQIRFIVTLETTSGLTGLVRLFNRKAVPPHPVTGSEMGTKSSISDILTSPVLTLPDSTNIYEVQIRLGGIAIPKPNDRVTCKLAQLEISDLTSTVISVDNIDELRSITKLEGMVNVKSFSSIGDGGGGNFIWDQYSPDEDNNGTIIRPNKQPPDTDGRWIRQFSEDINVRWFGAKGDTKGIAGEYKGTVSVSGTTGTLTVTSTKPVFGPKDKNKIIMIWDDSNPKEKPLVTPSKPYFYIINNAGDFTVEFTVEMQVFPTRDMCFAWGTDDTNAIQDAWKATWDEENKRVYRLIFPTGTYCVTSLKSSGIDSDGTKWDLPSAYLEGIGKVMIISPNSLGEVVGGFEKINEIINFTKSCGPASITNMIFQGISTPDAGIVQYSDDKFATLRSDDKFLTLPSPFNVEAQGGLHNHRAGIHYQGKDSIICKNVEVSNMPYAGLIIDYGSGQSLIENSYFHANGLYNIAAPGQHIDASKVRQCSIKLSHDRINDSIPVSWGYRSYGIDMGMCDFTAVDCDFVNNAGFALSNDVANPSTMTIDNCRFAFGKYNGKLSFPKIYDSVKASAGSNIVEIKPFPLYSSNQGSPYISIPGVVWSLVEDPLDPKPRVLSRGTHPPNIKITGTTNQDVILRIECTLPGKFGEWKFRYSTDGEHFSKKEIPSDLSVPIYSIDSSGNISSPTGLTLNIEKPPVGKEENVNFRATLDNVWTADNTYTLVSEFDFALKRVITKQKVDYVRTPTNNKLSWIAINTSALLVDNATCQNFSCTNCLFKGTDAHAPQFAAIIIKGHEYDHDAYHRALESQRVVKIIGNTFDTFDVNAIIHSLIWGAKEIRIQNNVFVDSPFSLCIVHEPGPDPFDNANPDHQILVEKEGKMVLVPAFDKKAISKIVHLSGNTYVDVGHVYLGCGGLIRINDETVIYTGKLSSSDSTHFYIYTCPTGWPDPAKGYPGRVGRVIRRNNTISGQIASKLYYPSTSFAIKLYYPSTLAPEDPSPKWWSWHEGDREEINLVGFTYYPYYGFLGSTSTVLGKETELTVTKFWSSAPDGITGQFQAGREISMLYWDSAESKHKNVTWGGLPHVALAAVDRTAGVGKVCARTALPADIAVSKVDVSAPSSYGFLGSTSTVLGKETELTVDTLLPGGFTDQFQAGREISMPKVTWGGLPHVALAAVDRTAGVGKVCARTALPADIAVSKVDVSAPSSYGFLGSTSTVLGKETELTVDTLLPGGFTDQFQAGREISMLYWDSAESKHKNVTWGGLPHVALAAVDRTAGVGKVCARTALLADIAVLDAYVLPPQTPFYYGGRICTAPGTFGKCTAKATTTKGNYSIIIDDVLTLCPQQIISIDNVGGTKLTFSSPNAVHAIFTEVVDVIGYEGHRGSIIVRDAPDDSVINAPVSFVSPTLALYDKTASTGVVSGAP